MGGAIMAGMLYGTILTLVIQFGIKGIRKISRRRRAMLVSIIVNELLSDTNKIITNTDTRIARHAAR